MKENDEIQSRREFFKNAAKKALPILGVAFLGSLPLNNVMGAKLQPSGCEYSCSGSCSGGCSGCSGSCSGGCSGCSGTCSSSCTSSSN